MLMLVPAGVLAVVVLASIAVDSANAYLARHELQLAAASAANDAVAGGLDEGALRSGRGLSLDPVRARAVAEASLRAGGLADDLVEPPSIVLDEVLPGEGGRVTVELASEVEPIFAAALPGGGRPTLVRASATAVAERR